MHKRLTSLLTVLLVVSMARVSSAEDAVVYTVSIPAPQTQMVEMAVAFPILESGATIDIHLPTWRIGRYSILDFAGGVRKVRAQNERGESLEIEKIRKSTWRVTPGSSRVVEVRYRVYANEGSLRTRHVDDTHAFLSGTSVFMYMDSCRDLPCHVRLEMPESWEVATGLEPLNGDDRVRYAANYDVLVDSPLELGIHDRIDFDVLGLPHEIIIWPAGLDIDRERFIEDFSAIVETQHAVFEAFPYERYVFLIHAGLGGGGTEHLNSTIMQTSVNAVESSVGNRSAYTRFLGLVSHEFFHTWNVKALRPAGLVPYDYQSENYTTLLWVAEGTTSYYDDLTLPRAGLMKPSTYLNRLGGTIGSIRERPGAKIQSVSASSFDAWVKFNHSSPDDVNSEVSFYSKGALVSFLLDLSVRDATGNSASLDDVMRVMYERYPLEAGGFTADDLKSVLREVSGRDMSDLFDQYIDGTAALPWEDVLGTVGLVLEFEYNDDPRGAEDAEDDADGGARLRPDLGVSLSSADGFARVRSVVSDGPAYLAGVLPGDLLIAIDGRRVSASGLDDDLRIRFDVGQDVELLLMRRDQVREFNVTLSGVPDGDWVLRRVDEPSDAQRSAYEDWIGQPWPGGSADDDSDES